MSLIDACRIFHFGSLSLTDEPARSATVAAVSTAKRLGKLISFDPNLRQPLWSDLTVARAQRTCACGQCDILKCSVEEALFITGEDEPGHAISRLQSDYPNVKILFMTKGTEGATVYYKHLEISAPTYLSVKTIDTTGAGDTFLGACLAKLLDHDIDQLDEPILSDCLRFANAASSLVTTKQGALLAMPEEVEILKLMKQA